VRTIELLAAFGIKADETEDGLIIPGEQILSSPTAPIETHLDHRLAMTAMILASKVGADIVGADICEVTHPGFIEQLLALGTKQ
jgi:5-enolpyruvylshikimate-3-phosphate synthase